VDHVSKKTSTQFKKKTNKSSILRNAKENLTSSYQEFIDVLGKNINKYSKIEIHWLTALRNRLSFPFDQKTIELLRTT